MPRGARKADLHQHSIYTNKCMWHSLYCIFMVKRDKCNKVLISLLQLILPPCYYCYNLQVFNLDKSTWMCGFDSFLSFFYFLCKSKTSREHSEASVIHQLRCTSDRVSTASKAPQRHSINERFVETTQFFFFLKVKRFCPLAQSVLQSAFTAATMQWVSGGGDQGTKAVAN